MTVYEAMRQKLGREPTHRELNDEVKRILEESYIQRATKGKLPHQRRGQGRAQ